MKLVRGQRFGPDVEIEFASAAMHGEGQAKVIENGTIVLFDLKMCRQCGVIVADAEQHADFHYALAAGKPYGDGPPPGFRS